MSGEGMQRLALNEIKETKRLHHHAEECYLLTKNVFLKSLCELGRNFIFS